MRDVFLEVTYREGRPFAAYYHLPRMADDTSAKSRGAESGMVIDYASDGRAIGIEITEPALLTLEDLNRVLHELGLPEATDADLAPLHAA